MPPMAYPAAPRAAEAISTDALIVPLGLAVPLRDRLKIRAHGDGAGSRPSEPIAVAKGPRRRS
jgi:hypothetical protein